METLKARLISRINYDKLFMVVLYYKYKLKQPDFLDASFLTFFFLPSVLQVTFINIDREENDTSTMFVSKDSDLLPASL